MSTALRDPGFFGFELTTHDGYRAVIDPFPSASATHRVPLRHRRRQYRDPGPRF